MYPRTNYEMTQEDLDAILDSCKSVPMIMLHIGGQSSPQENANRAWDRLGKKMGFDYMTVQPIHGKGNRFFSAVPSENETQKSEREAREAEEKRQSEVKRLTSEISERQQQLSMLTASPAGEKEGKA